MGVSDRGFKSGTWHLNLSLLKWVSIVLPLLFLVGMDILRHTLFDQQLHTLSGFLVTYSIIAFGIVLFSRTVFSLIERLQSKLKEQNQQLSAMNAIAIAASQKLHLEELLQTGLDQVMNVIKADAGLICIVDLERQEHSAVSYRGFSPELVRRIQRAKLRDTPIAQEVVRTGQAVVIERVLEDPRIAEVAAQEGIRFFINAPLKAEGEVNGLLVVATRKERHFTPADETLLQVIGGELGMAIRNAVLFERSQRQNRELAALVKAGKAVSTSLDLDEVLGKSLEAVLAVTSADDAEIWLTDEDGLVMRAHYGAHPEAFHEQTRFRLGEGFPGLVARTKSAILTHDLPADPRFLRTEVVQAGYRSFCALPLVFQEQVVGVLAVAALSADVLSREGEVALLEAIGERIAAAIANAELHRQIQHLAVLQERERLAREMHDGMAQVLGYINTEILTAKKLCSDRRLEEANEELGRTQEIVRQLYADVREGILGLKIASQERGGILHALREYLEWFREMSGIQVSFEVGPQNQDFRLRPSVEVQLIRIVQEALSNVRKHAGATAVRVALAAEGDKLRCEVTDNGQGFEPHRLSPKGWPRFGLQTMRERAEAVGGSFAIESRLGHGTKVMVKLPLGE